MAEVNGKDLAPISRSNRSNFIKLFVFGLSDTLESTSLDNELVEVSSSEGESIESGERTSG